MTLKRKHTDEHNTKQSWCICTHILICPTKISTPCFYSLNKAPVLHSFLCIFDIAFLYIHLFKVRRVCTTFNHIVRGFFTPKMTIYEVWSQLDESKRENSKDQYSLVARFLVISTARCTDIYTPTKEKKWKNNIKQIMKYSQSKKCHKLNDEIFTNISLVIYSKFERIPTMNL